MEFERNQYLQPTKAYLQIITSKMFAFFLYQPSHAEPCLFLIYYLLKNFHFITLDPLTNYLILTAGILAMVITKKNYYFYYLAFL